MKGSNKQSYWFKRRRYGYGWIPTSWQGWTTVAVFLFVVLGGTTVLKDTPRNTFSSESSLYLLIVLIAIVGLVIVSYLKGPKPKWRWGKDKKDNPYEDF